MRCIEIVNPRVEKLSDRDTVLDAATAMADAGVGFLPVCDARGKVLGVVTDRDLVVRAMAMGVDPAHVPITRLMTSPAITCLADADLHVAEDLMEKEHKSRLVLVDADGAMAGVLSIADIAELAPRREALHTLQVVLMREALGPRGGAEPGTVLLGEQPLASPMPEADLPHTTTTVFEGGHRVTTAKTFPG